MGKRIISLQEAQSITNDDYLVIDNQSGGTKKVSAGFINDIVSDVEVDGTSVVNNGVAEIDLSGKQDTIVAGSNITIAADGKTISATDTTYTAGTNVQINNGVISATDTTYTAGTNVQIESGVISATDTTYTAGTNVQIDNGVISATDTTYSAGTNVQINNGVISATDTTYSAFGGATAGADGSSGLVPQPLIADKDKFLKGDGTWDTIQPGASALDDLTNVDITSPTNGQVLKYDSTNQEWVNANESGGGGASAVADLTDVNLTSLANGQILKYDSTSQKWINSDESGGGTGGTMDTLWEGTAAPTTANPITVSLNGNISDYDMIMVNGYEGTNDVKCTGTFVKLAVGDNGLLLATSDNQLYINIEVATDSSITFKGYSSQWGSSTTYTGIYGVKFGTGGGGSGGILKGLDYANAVTLTLPDHTGYDYTPTGYGVLMATSYGGVGSIVITGQNEDVKYLSFRDDTWTTSWIPVTKDETYHVNRGSSSTDFPSGSWFKFIPWLCEGGGGGTDVIELTQSEYNALPDGEKNNGCIYMVSSQASTPEELTEAQTNTSTAVTASSYTYDTNLNQYHYPWCAFNRVSPNPNEMAYPTPGVTTQTCWSPNPSQDGSNSWICYHFDRAYKMTSMTINSFTDYSSSATKSIVIEGSNDGTNWTNILLTGNSFSLNSDLHTLTPNSVNLNSDTAYEYVRLRSLEPMGASYQPTVFIDEIFVYGYKSEKALKKIYYMGTEYGNTGGGSSAEEMTLTDYNELTTEQKNDGTIRFIPKNPYGIITDVDMSTITNLSDSAITVTPSADEIEMDFDHNDSYRIGGTFYISAPINVTNYDYLKYDLTTGVCYNSLHGDTNPLRNLGIGLCQNAPSTWQYCPNVNWAVSKVYDVNDVNSTFTDEVIDVSELTGTYYFVVAFVAWEATISNLKFATAGGYPSQIKYMDKTYGISSGGEGYTEDILYSATPTTEAPATLTLSHAYTDYDMLIFNLWRSADGVMNKYDRFILTSQLNISDRIQLITYNEYASYDVTTSTSFTLINENRMYLENVIGIKFGGGSSSQTTYSTTEHKVGTWIDGSDVYEKTISISNVSLSSGSYETVDTITGLDTIISCNGYAVEGNLKYTLNDITLRVIQDGTSVKLYSPSGTTWTISSGAIIIRYTKVAAS